jgi:hypothetical protein
MPEMTIQLRCDPATGRRDIVVKLHGDADLLPHEHEDLHRRLVERLVEGGVLQAGESGRLVVEREDGVEITRPAAEESGGGRRAAELRE